MAWRLKTSIISLIGAPGSGKGTYGSMLASRIQNSTFLSVGDILREQSELKETLRSGSLVDDSFVNEAIMQQLKQISNQAASAKSVVLLDGFPRNEAQASLLSKWPSELQNIQALHFSVPDDICITKLLGRRKCIICKGSFNVNDVDANGFYMPPLLPADGSCPVQCNMDTDWQKRDDDTEGTIRARMEVYHKQTKPVLKYWSELGKLHTFVPYNGVEDIDEMIITVDKMLRNV
jgi:adenylate kinase